MDLGNESLGRWGLEILYLLYLREVFGCGPHILTKFVYTGVEVSRFVNVSLGPLGL